MLEFIALGMLTQTPLTGYDIKKAIESGIGTFYKASFGSLYPLLKRLTEKGLLTFYDEEQGNRKKKYYQITEDGETAFLEWLREPISFDDSTDRQLAKIFFFDKLPSEERELRLSEYEKDCGALLKKLRLMLKQYEQPNCDYYKFSTLYYGISTTQTTLRWCRLIKSQSKLTELIDE